MKASTAGARKIFKLIDALEDSDDVQNVFANFDVSDEVMEKVAVLAAVVEAKKILEAGDTLFSKGITKGTEQGDLLHELHLLTTKPFLYVFNVDEDELTDDAFKAEQSALVAPAEAIFLNAKLEQDLSELDDEEALELLQSVGQDEPGLATLGRVGFATLGLQSGDAKSVKPFRTIRGKESGGADEPDL